MQHRFQKPIIICLITIVLLLNLSIGLEAANLDRRLAKPAFGIKLGFLNSSTVTVTNKLSGEKNRFVWSAGFIGGPFFDINITKAVKFSIAAELQDVQLFDDREKLLDLNCGIKTTIYIPQKQFALRPGFAIGYGYLSNVGDINKMSAVTSKIYLEAVFLGSPRYSLVTDFGFGWIPRANTDEYKIKSNPYMFIRAGIMM